MNTKQLAMKKLLKQVSNPRNRTIRCYDNGGKTADRYTVVYLREPESRFSVPKTFAEVGMSPNPFHPQGLGQNCTARPGKHLGKRISFSDLPKDCQTLVLTDLNL